MPSQQPTRTNRVRVAYGLRALTAASDKYAAYAAYVTAKFDAYARTDAVVSLRLGVQTQIVRPVRSYSRVRSALILSANCYMGAAGGRLPLEHSPVSKRTRNTRHTPRTPLSSPGRRFHRTTWFITWGCWADRPPSRDVAAA